jgi:elongation factor 2
MHVDICLKDLENEYAGCAIKRSNPVVTYKETVTREVEKPLLVKTQNKLNRVFATSSQINEKLTKIIEDGGISFEDGKELSRRLVQDFEWEKQEAANIWCFGPENNNPNMLLDMTKGVQHLSSIKDHLCASFQSFTRHGALV